MGNTQNRNKRSKSVRDPDLPKIGEENDLVEKYKDNPVELKQKSKWGIARTLTSAGVFGSTSNVTKTVLPIIQKQDPIYLGKKTLVLDLDDTLVQSVQHKDTCKSVPIDFKVEVNLNRNAFIEILVYKRPGVDIFLNKMAKYFEIIIFTASLNIYAEPVMAQLDTNGVCKTILHRKHCELTSNGHQTKNL